MNKTLTEQPATHTPGPWSVFNKTPTIVRIPDASGRFVDGEVEAFGHGGSNYEETICNARLIAAAPELLEAARQTVSVMRASVKAGHVSKDSLHMMVVEKLEAAIAKATGGAQ